jgi:D-sedoheptulose 7-phosphate isomerase
MASPIREHREGNVNNLSRAFSQSRGSAEVYAKEYLRYLKSVLDSLDLTAVGEVAKCLEKARRDQKTVFFVGNGGSAATCSHFANDLVKACRTAGKPGFRAVSLTDNVSLMTAIANDDGYENVFTGQMRDLFRKGDVLVAISASGNSPNIVAAARLARELGGEVIGVVGFDGGELRRLSDYSIHVVSEKGEYGPVEDVHMILDHLVTSYLAFLQQQ